MDYLTQQPIVQNRAGLDFGITTKTTQEQFPLQDDRLPAPIDLEVAVTRAYKSWEQEKDGSPERGKAFHKYKVRLDAYHAVFGKKHPLEAVEPNDWMDFIGWEGSR